MPASQAIKKIRILPLIAVIFFTVPGATIAFCRRPWRFIIAYAYAHAMGFARHFYCARAKQHDAR